MATKAKYTISAVRSSVDLKDTISLFYEYATYLGIDLSFQNFDAEMAAMPGKYSPPTGELLLARDQDGRASGCVAVRPLGLEKVCEMKRLYVSEGGRGSGLGKALATGIIEVAERLGYAEMRLDTLPSMKAAMAMYEKLGFIDIEAYYPSPMEGTRYLALKLSQKQPSEMSSS